MFPVVGILSVLASALGLYGFCWYESLSTEDQRKADTLAVQYARNVYGKALDALTFGQMENVQKLVKAHFA